MAVKSVKPGLSSTRPPIVAVLGHVDHGKTSLIGKIKEIDLTKKEFGGISQHIEAYQINYKGKKITFIDTPGHLCFSKMRSRGSSVADLVVLVVAADEGVKPQTLESLEHIKAAKIPYLVALNKIDLPVNIDKVKGNLAKNGILIEGFGGDIVAVPVSAKTGQGIDDLLEMILLLSEMKGLKGDSGEFEAVVIESRLVKNKGPIATILVRKGCLLAGQEITIENTVTKIKAMFDDTGKRVAKAYAGQPVEVLGFSNVPPIGSRVSLGRVVTGQVAQKISKVEMGGEDKKLKVILKADAVGTLEAIEASLPQEIQVVSSGVGPVSQSDILLASTTKADVIGFNTKVLAQEKSLAQEEKVKIKTYNVIYELLEELEKAVLRMLEPNIDEQILGEAEIIAEFQIKNDRIAGCKVKTGLVSKNDKVHLKREDKIIGEARIKSLRIGKVEASQVKKDGECGIVLAPVLDFTIGDVLVSYRPAQEE